MKISDEHCGRAAVQILIETTSEYTRLRALLEEL